MTLTIAWLLVLGARQAGLRIGETTDLMGFSHIAIFRTQNGVKTKPNKTKVQRASALTVENVFVDGRGRRRIASLVRADEKITVTQITLFRTTVSRKATQGF